jgi:hypothetical protein
MSPRGHEAALLMNELHRQRLGIQEMGFRLHWPGMPRDRVLRDVGKRFGSVVALDGVDLAIRKGERRTP